MSAPLESTKQVVPAVEAGAVERLKAIIMLAGSVRPSRMASGIGRSVLDLPIDENRRVLNLWEQSSAQIAELWKRHILPLRVLINPRAVHPNKGDTNDMILLTIESDPLEYRGTAGVLKDVLGEYEDDDLVLVVAGAQMLYGSLIGIVEQLMAPAADVALLAPRDGTPSGFFLLRCGVIRDLPSEGYIDFKEQALPKIAQKYRVQVVHEELPSALPLRTLSDYVTALMRFHSKANVPTSNDAFGEDWLPVFSIIEQGAMVHPNARIHNSVILKGAVVEPGAVIVRSIVCPNVTIRAETMIVDQVVSAISSTNEERT